MTLRGPALLCALGLLWLFAGFAKASDPKVSKLVWAHYVGWGFDFSKYYENPRENYIRLDDYPLLPNGTATDEGLESTTRMEILTALQYGIDGFVVDIPKSRFYASALKRLYKSAEGLPFYIALCVDGWSGPPAEVAEHLVEFLERWGRHPNNYFIDEKPVIFLYKHGKSPEECLDILQRVRARGWDAYWIVQPQRETTLWSDSEKLDENLAVFDALYDFGANGFGPEELTQRLMNGRAALRRSGKQGILVAGITRGYSGSLNAFYRPYYGTGAMRNNWAAAKAAKADWVCLATWNDYWENTHFMPSKWGRDVLLRVNREFAREWKNEPLIRRPPQVMISYMESVRLGDDWELEILSLPHTSEPGWCHVKLVDLEGRVLLEKKGDPLPANQVSAAFVRMEQPGFEGERIMRVLVALSKDGDEPGEREWKELYPVTIRPGIVKPLRPIHFSLDSVEAGAAVRDDGGEIVATPPSKSWMGSIELLCDGICIAKRTVRPPQSSQRFELTDVDDSKLHVYTVRFERADHRVSFSKPIVRHPKGGRALTTNVPIRKMTFDRAWGGRRNALASFRKEKIFPYEVFGFRYLFQGDPLHIRDVGGWNVGAIAGIERHRKVNPAAVPVSVKETLSTGGIHPFFRFNGVGSRIVIAPRSLPHGPLTFEAVIRPRRTGAEGCVFSDQNLGIIFSVTSDGNLRLQRRKDVLESQIPIQFDRWNHVAGVYSGRDLRIYLNGKLTGQSPARGNVVSINSIPVIGARVQEFMRFSRFYCGDIDSVSVEARIQEPRDFYLLSRANRLLRGESKSIPVATP